MIFNRRTWQNFSKLALPFFQSKEKWVALRLFSLIILCSLTEIYTSVGLNHFNKNFFNALENFDQTALIISLLHFAYLLVLMVLACGYLAYLSGLLSVAWRRYLTAKFLNAWMYQKIHYPEKCLSPVFDNPDQRISEDIDRFTNDTVTLFMKLFTAAITLICFGFILWQLSPYLFLGGFLYALIGTLAVNKIGAKLSQLDYAQEKYNADFRYDLVKLRKPNEDDNLSQPQLMQRFEKIFENFLQINRLNLRLTFFNKSYNTASYMFGIIITLPMYLAKRITLGTVMQVSGAFSYVISAFSVFVNAFNLFAKWQAQMQRLIEFSQGFETHDPVIYSDNLRLCQNSSDMYLS